jgi:hypothetical protein
MERILSPMGLSTFQLNLSTATLRFISEQNTLLVVVESKLPTVILTPKAGRTFMPNQTKRP